MAPAITNSSSDGPAETTDAMPRLVTRSLASTAYADILHTLRRTSCPFGDRVKHGPDWEWVSKDRDPPGLGTIISDDDDGESCGLG